MVVRSVRPATWGVLAAIAAFTAVPAVDAGGGVARTVSNLGILLAAVAAGVAGLLRARRHVTRLRWTWAGIALGSLSYAAGQAAGIAGEWYGPPQAYPPGWADAAHLAMVPLVVAGLLLVPVDGRSVANRARSIVDGLMVAVSLVMGSWFVLLRPVLAADSGSAFAGLIGDLAMAAVVLYTLTVLRRGGPDFRPLVLAGAALLLIAVCDAVHAVGEPQRLSHTGSLLDAGWFAAFALILLAARRPVRTGPARPADDRQPFAIVIPYATVIGTLLIGTVGYAFSAGTGGQTDPHYTWVRSALLLLIVVREVLTLLESRHLTRRLESRVAERTAELYASEQRFRALVRQSSESVAVLEADSTVRYQSESIERIFGYLPEQLVGRRLVELVGRRAGARLAAAIEAVRREPYATMVIPLTVPHADGRRREAELTVTNLLDDPAVAGLVLNTRDVHDARELQQQLVHEAYHDSLTGLASRALFGERLDEALRTSRRTDDVVILFLDLDGFKEVNDSLGHAVGDQLLVRVAERVRAAVRDDDTVARFGGDEFAVLIQSVVAVADAETVAQRIITALTEPFPIGDRELRVGASIGLASAADAVDVQQLLRNADLAMYRAKSAGGSAYVSYHPQMHDRLMDRLELEADLRAALDRDELALHYQPTVDLRTGEIIGFEALVRWHHPVRGTVSPLDFIGTAEATGLIVPLGRWVLAEACRQAVLWGAGRERPLKMAVNVSVRQFDHTDLAATVAEVLDETGMPASGLVLEMTESVLLTDTDENLTQLLRLKALGVTLAMDDFGTGYSSLAYLRRFPMDILKIDRSFVSRLGGDSRDRALVATIVRLGRSMGMRTVAEGIEDDTQLAALREMGCDLAQGFLLSRPLPAPAATRVLADGLPHRLITA